MVIQRQPFAGSSVCSCSPRFAAGQRDRAEKELKISGDETNELWRYATGFVDDLDWHSIINQYCPAAHPSPVRQSP